MHYGGRAGSRRAGRGGDVEGGMRCLDGANERVANEVGQGDAEVELGDR